MHFPLPHPVAIKSHLLRFPNGARGRTFERVRCPLIRFGTRHHPCSFFLEPRQLFCVNEVDAVRRSPFDKASEPHLSLSLMAEQSSENGGPAVTE
jgi:hypothetical protein